MSVCLVQSKILSLVCVKTSPLEKQFISLNKFSFSSSQKIYRRLTLCWALGRHTSETKALMVVRGTQGLVGEQASNAATRRGLRKVWRGQHGGEASF